ncbi:ATP-binding protein [Hathewaya limosa]|uniref:histidine kinase n=1 Tax=Hathewaya limosa TaxID=1536 RepID=A0ABU0JTM6_HATLI|nr:cache domain-containing protein [Hathewaya limosa]MDQ0480455.1 signal transduction histidine kinase [Hathewaya limosa]
MKKTLKGRFMFPVLLSAALGICVLIFIFYSQAKQIITSDIEKMSKDKVEKMVDNVDNKLKNWKEILQILATDDEAKRLNGKDLFNEISKQKKIFDDFELMTIIDEKGNYYDSKHRRGNVSDRQYFKDSIEGYTSISEPIISKRDNKAVIVISTPISDKKNIKGVLCAEVSLSYLTYIINCEKIGEKGYAFMIDSVGRLMAYPDKNKLLTTNIIDMNDEDLNSICKDMIKGIDGVGRYNYNGELKMVAYKHVLEAPWSIAMTANYKEVFHDLEVFKNFIIVIGIIVLAIIIYFIYIVVNSVTEPIKEIKDCIEIATTGNLEVQCNINSKDELGVLGDRLNKLINENKRLIDETIEYDRIKMEFFANISHELKTPINIIFSTVQLLSLYANKNEDVSFNDLEQDKMRKYLKIMEQNSYRLIRCVNNLIDLTELDCGVLTPKLVNTNIVEVVEEITMATVEYVKSKDKKIIFDTDIEEKYMAIDVEKIERIILNLISNALKFTEPKDVIIVGIYDKGEEIDIVVKDSGKGIPQDKQKIIFERFRQVDQLLNRDHEGSGIGLSLVKALVEMHNGEIRVKSKVGEGSEFIITLPVHFIKGQEIEENKLVREPKIQKIEIEFSDIYG